jgi:tape measure domain-containing protein
MATIASIMVKIGANSSALQKELKTAQKELNATFGSESMSMSKYMIAGIAGIGASLAALGVKAVQAAGNMQQVQAAMTNMLGSAGTAQDLLGKLQDFAANTPFEFNDVAQASQKFLAFGFTAEQIIPTLRAVGDAAAGVGLGQEGVNRLTLAMGQMAAKGKVAGDEMLQLTEAGIPAWQMLADKIGVSIPEAMDMVTKGTVNAQTGLQALTEGMETRFGGMMDQQALTITGTWSNMMDGIGQAAVAVGQQISDAFDLPDLFSNIGNQLQQFAAVVKDQGIGEAVSRLIPPEVQLAAEALAITLTAATIPAIVNLGLSAGIAGAGMVTGLAGNLAKVTAGVSNFPAALTVAKTGIEAFGSSIKTIITFIPTMGVKLVGLAASFGPVGIAIAAVGIAITAFLASGHSLEDMFSVVPGTMDSVRLAGTALKTMFGEIGVALQNLVSAAAPLIALFATAFTVAMYAIIAILNVFITILATVLTVASDIITGLIAGFNWAYSGISGALNRIGDALGNMVDSVLPKWASDGLKTIKSFVQTAVGWLQNLITKIFQTNNALSNAGNKMTAEEKSRRKATNEIHDNASSSTNNYVAPDFSQFSGGADGGTAASGKGSKSGGSRGTYNPREGAIYNAQALTGRSYGTDDGQVVCTTYVENAWSGAGLTNAFDLGDNSDYWAQNAGAAFHSATSSYVGKPGDAAIVADNEGDPTGHVIMIDENGTGYYAAAGIGRVSQHYDQDYHDAFAGQIYGYINMAEYGGFQDTSSKAAPAFNWDQSTYTQAIKAAADAYSIDPKLLLAVAMRESGGDTVSGLTMEGGNGGGMMQILGGNQDVLGSDGERHTISSMYGDYQSNVFSNAMAGAAMLKDKINTNGGDTWAGVADYYGGSDKADYANQVKGNYQKLGGNGGQLLEQQLQYQKKMIDQAQQTSKQIDDNYAQSTATQEELIDRKYKKEYEKLEESKTFNGNYVKDKEKLDALYAEDHLKAVEADAKKTMEIQQKALDISTAHTTSTSPLTMSASDQELAKMEAEYDKTVSSIESRWQRYSEEFAGMTAAQKEVFLKALDDENVAYEIAQDGRISFNQAALDEQTAAYQSYLDKRMAYFNQAKDIEADLTAAKNDMDMAALEEVLTEENALRMSDYEAQKSMMDTYQETFLAAHASTAEMVASLYSTAFSGLSSTFTDLIMGTKTLQDAFGSLGKSMIQVIVEFYAKQLAGMITNGAMAKAQAATATATTAAEGISMAAALGPAAFLKLVIDPGSAAVATGLLAAGTTAAAGLSMGSALASGSGLLFDKQESISSGFTGPMMASGGITKGATVAMIGEGHYDEAVLPLSRDKFERLGLTSKGQQVNSVTMHVSALDASSFTDFLRNGGLDTIRQELFDTNRNFASETGVF